MHCYRAPEFYLWGNVGRVISLSVTLLPSVFFTYRNVTKTEIYQSPAKNLQNIFRLPLSAGLMRGKYIEKDKCCIFKEQDFI